MKPQWCTLLSLDKGDKGEIKQFLSENSDFSSADYEDTFRYFRESELKYQPNPGETDTVTTVQEISFKIINGHIIVYQGSKKARYIANRLNKADYLEVDRPNFNMKKTYSALKDSYIVEPSGIKIGGFKVNKFVVGKLEANVSREKSFSELMDEQIDKYKLKISDFREEVAISIYRSGQVRIHGKHDFNTDIFDKIMKKVVKNS